MSYYLKFVFLIYQNINTFKYPYIYILMYTQTQTDKYINTHNNIPTFKCRTHTYTCKHIMYNTVVNIYTIR